MQKLSVQEIKNKKQGTILSKGTFIDGGNTNLEGTNQEVKWVAVAGAIDDFAIYYEYIYSNDSETLPNLGEWSDARIATQGNKLPSMFVKYIIDIDEDGLLLYRG